MPMVHVPKTVETLMLYAKGRLNGDLNQVRIFHVKPQPTVPRSSLNIWRFYPTSTVYRLCRLCLLCKSTFIINITTLPMYSLIHGLLNILSILFCYYIIGGINGLIFYLIFNVFHILYLTLRLDDE